nr:MAG TPA: hypothetical protein [Caudoviricetes sp.]
MEDIIIMILTWMVENDIHWYLFAIAFLLMPFAYYSAFKMHKDIRDFLRNKRI